MAGAAPKSISATAAPNPSGPGAVHLKLPRARSVAAVVRSMASRSVAVSGTSLSSHLARVGLLGQAEVVPEEVLTAPRVITGAETVVDGAVVLGDRLVSWAGRAQALPQEYAGLPRTDYPGATILPGLIDSHVHLGFDGGPDPAARMQA